MPGIMIDTDCNAACCPCKIVDIDTGKDLLVQTDWDFPGFASTFGWSVSEVKPSEPSFYTPDWRNDPEHDPDDTEKFERYEKQLDCDHDGTDGTVACRQCGLDASTFINSAREYLENNDGKEAEDPGYFG